MDREGTHLETPIRMGTVMGRFSETGLLSPAEPVWICSNHQLFLHIAFKFRDVTNKEIAHKQTRSKHGSIEQRKHVQRDSRPRPKQQQQQQQQQQHQQELSKTMTKTMTQVSLPPRAQLSLAVFILAQEFVGCICGHLLSYRDRD